MGKNLNFRTMVGRTKRTTKASTKPTEPEVDTQAPTEVEAPVVEETPTSYHFKVFNLSLSTTEDCFHFFTIRHFKPTNCHIERSEDKHSTGCGYFTITSLEYNGNIYNSPSAYTEALNSSRIRLDNKSLHFINIDAETVESGDQLYIEYLPVNSTLQNIYDTFSTLGVVTDVRMTIGARSAAVRFVKTDKAYENNVSEVTINEKKLNVKRMSGDRVSNVGGNRDGIRNEQKVFIYDYDDTLKKEEVREYFSGYGELVDVMMAERDHPEKGVHRYGFVSFKDENIASQLIEKGSHVINGKNLSVKTAINNKNKGSYGDRNRGGNGYNRSGYGRSSYNDGYKRARREY
eukprot:GAHX01000583.1.p1 GENE.GAHX01000583.1~~GAHX01000583.1.p1  ORF type:complete len:346 (+),score=65.49 GAHX01000583.1:3-1040(+)